MTRRAHHLLAVAVLVVLPLILLWPSLLGRNTYVTWDLAQFAPAATLMDAGELAAVKRSNNAIYTEVPTMFLPELRFMQSELARGQLPQWNPYARSGTPIWSSSILGAWYPLNWMFFAGGDPADDLALAAFLALVIAGLLMYGLLLHLGLSPPAALFGALAFELSGTLIVNLPFYMRAGALIWLPGLLWAISALRGRGGRQRVPAALGLAACIFMTLTAGFPPYALAVLLIAVAFTVVQLCGVATDAGPRAAVGYGLAVGGAAVLGVLLASVQTLPMFAFIPESNRDLGQVDNYFASNGFDPAGLIGYLCPTLFNHPHLDSSLDATWSPFFWWLYSRASWVAEGGVPAGTVFEPNLNFCEYTVFAGTLPLFFAVAGLLAGRGRWRWFAGAALGGLLLLGSASPLVEPLLELPPFKWIPPTRYTGPVCALLAVLAAAGVHRLRELPAGVRRLLWIGGFGVAAACLGLGLWVYAKTPDELLAAITPTLSAKYAARLQVPADAMPALAEQYLGRYMPVARSQAGLGLLMAALTFGLGGLLFLLLPRLLARRHGHAAVIAFACVLTATELLTFAIPLNTGRVLQRRPLDQTPVHEFLRQAREREAPAGGFAVLRAHDAGKHGSGVIPPTQLPPGTLLGEHIRDLQMYTFVDRWSHLPFLAIYGPEQLARGFWPLSLRDDAALQLPYWDMLGVRYILSEDELRFAGARVGPVLSGPESEDVKTKHFYVYERPGPLPRAWVVHAFREVEGGDEAIVRALVAPDFRPADEVLLDTAAALRLGPQPHRSDAEGNRRKVRFPEHPRRHETNTLTIEVEAGEPGYLVVNDTCMSGWTATINGRPAGILRGNLFQRVLALPGDAATVQFRYTTPGFRAGALLSGLAVLLVLGLAIWYGWPASSRRRRHRVEETR